jgi:hypothetical protein
MQSRFYVLNSGRLWRDDKKKFGNDMTANRCISSPRAPTEIFQVDASWGWCLLILGWVTLQKGIPDTFLGDVNGPSPRRLRKLIFLIFGGLRNFRQNDIKMTSDFIVDYDSGPHELRFNGLSRSNRCLCQKLGHNYSDFFTK